MSDKAPSLSLAQTAPFAVVLLIGLVAFHLTTGEATPLIAIVSIAASEVVRVRLPHSRLLAGALRLAVFTPIIAHLGIPADTFPQWYLKPSYTTLAGCLLSAEAAIRAWEPPGGLLTGDQRGVMFFVSALLLAAATNTGDRAPINWIAPTYVVFALLALRSFEGRPWRLSVLQVVRVSMIGVVLAGGLRLSTAITQYDDALNTFVERLLFRRVQRFQIGLASSPRLGRVFNPAQSLDRVMLVEGSISERYLAAVEFDHYQSQIWMPDAVSRPFVSADPRELRSTLSGTTLRFMRVGSDLNLLPMPLNSVSVESVAGVERDEFGSLRHTEQGLTGGSSAYTAVVAASDNAQGPRTLPLLESQRKNALELPDGFDPRAVLLSRELTAGKRDQSAVWKLANHLRSTHGYSLRYEPEGSEVISAFILHNSAAHCQYFASSLVMLCRASGIPARLVTGYYAYEPFSANTLVVRGRDAHAWAEAWIDGVGWISADATPASGRPDELFERSSGFRRLWERVSDWPGYFRDWISKFSADVIVIIVGCIAGLLFLAFAVRLIRLRQLARMQARLNAYHRPDRRLEVAARQFERWLARAGRRCPSAESWRAFVHELPEALVFVEAYEAARFGSQDDRAIATAVEELRVLRLQQVSRRRNSFITSSEKEPTLGR